MRPKFWIGLISGILLVLLGCSRAAEAEPSGAATQKPPSEAASGEAKAPKARKLLRTAELSLEVDSYPPTRRAIEKLVKEVDGYVAHAEVTHGDQSISTAKLELRVPNDKLERALRDVSKLGTVLVENVRSEDVTEQHYDLAARVTNARRLEQRLLALATRDTSELDNVLEVERELARVREQVEVLQGKLERLDDQVASSRLTVELKTRDKYASGEASSLGDQMSRTFSGSIAAMLTVGRGLLLLGTAVAPWLPLLLLAAYLGVVLVRRAAASS